jgi:hypothetical protein
MKRFISYSRAVLLFHRLFNRRKLVKIFSDPPDGLVCSPYEYGSLIYSIADVDGNDQCVRYIHDGWCIKTDGLYPKRLIIWDKIVLFLKFRFIGTAYVKFLVWLCRVWPYFGKSPANDILGNILFWPLRKRERE